MVVYPKIPGSGSIPLKSGVAFVKYDGSCINALWTRKGGFERFSLRKRLFDTTDPLVGPSVPLFLETYSEPLSKIFVDNKRFRGVRSMVAFCEFFGQESFAGLHKTGDPTQEVMLFDVWQDHFGMMSPRDFLNIFGKAGIKIAKVVYEGRPTGQFLDNVRNGKYDYVYTGGKFKVLEGVVCKGGEGDGWWAGKCKTNAYLEKLKEVYSHDWANFWE